MSKTKQAHPTIHTFPHQYEKRSKSFPPVRRNRAAGTVWSDSNTGNVDRFPAPRPRKKKVDPKENEFKLTETEDIALRNILKRTLQNVMKVNLRKITPTLRAADFNRSGSLPPSKVREVLQRRQFIIGDVGFSYLFKKFGERIKDDVVIKYEKLIPFLTKIWSEASELPKSKPSTPPAASGFFNYGSERYTGKSYLGSNLDFGYLDSYNGSSGYSSYPSYGSYPPQPRRILEMRNRVVFRDQDEAQLMVDLGRELSYSPINMADLRRTMYDYDRNRNNFLNQDQVYATFQKCGIFLSPDVFQRLLLATDRTGAGAYKIETLMNYLTRFQPEVNNHFVFGQSYNPRDSRIPVLPALGNQSTFLTPWNQQPQDFQSESSFFSDPNLQDGDAIQAPESNLVNEELSEEDFDAAEWEKDFSYLVKAIHKADHGNFGYMPEKEIRRLTGTYGLVYNLNISESTMSEAIRRSSDAKYNEINIDHFTSLLNELTIKESTK